MPDNAPIRELWRSILTSAVMKTVEFVVLFWGRLLFQAQTVGHKLRQTSYFLFMFVGFSLSPPTKGKSRRDKVILRQEALQSCIRNKVKLTRGTITQKSWKDERRIELLVHYCWDFCCDVQAIELLRRAVNANVLLSFQSFTAEIRGTITEHFPALNPEYISLKHSHSVRWVLLCMSIRLTYLFVLIKCGTFASGVALFHGDKTTECSHSACHLEKQSAAPDKDQIHSNYCTLNMRVYAPIFLLCFNLGNSQIAGVIDDCNYKKMVERDYCLMRHVQWSCHCL